MLMNKRFKISFVTDQLKQTKYICKKENFYSTTYRVPEASLHVWKSWQNLEQLPTDPTQPLNPSPRQRSKLQSPEILWYYQTNILKDTEIDSCSLDWLISSCRYCSTTALEIWVVSHDSPSEKKESGANHRKTDLLSGG
jgi:hypothetical protein